MAGTMGPYKGAPFEPTFPYRTSNSQSGFSTLGVAHALDLWRGLRILLSSIQLEASERVAGASTAGLVSDQDPSFHKLLDVTQRGIG